MMALMAAATIMLDGQSRPAKTTDSVTIQCPAHTYVVTTVSDYKHGATVTITRDGADALAPAELARIADQVGAYETASIVFVQCEPDDGLDLNFVMKGPLDRHPEELKLFTAGWGVEGSVSIRSDWHVDTPQ